MQQSSRNGTKLGAYTLNRLIARGGMGEVYEAYESKLERRVALKLIAPTDPNEHDQDELIRRFMQEARTLAKVNHPNIVTIFSIDNIVDVPFIAMEYVDGVAFRDLIEQFTFTADGAAPLFLQMCEGVKCLHDNHIIHRDLKPHNVLLRRDGQVKILDFGIAKRDGGGDQTRAGVVVGTLPYMPPEVRSGAPASPRSDIWSLGAIFYECLTGDRLISAQAEAPKGIEVPFNAAEVARIPVEMRAIITKMCAARPASRYQGVGEVMEDLRQFRAARPPVPAATWEILTQKVDEIAAASREIADQEQPRVQFTQLLAKQARQEHTPLSGEIRDITGERQRAQINRQHGGMTGPVVSTARRRWIVPVLALILAAGVVLKIRQRLEPATPVTATPTVSAAPAAAAPAAPESIMPVVKPLAPPAPAKVELEIPRLTDPGDGATLVVDAEHVPTFAWSRLLEPGEYRFELAGDRGFRDVRVSEPVVGGSYRPARPLDGGKYYWRLSPARPPLKTVGPSVVTFTVTRPVTLVSPNDQEHVGLKPREDGAGVQFKWNCPTRAARFQIEITLGKSTKPLVQQSVTGCEASPRRLSAGEYHWRVRAEGQSAWSDTRTLLVDAAAVTPSTASIIAGPNNTAVFHPPRATLTEPHLIEPNLTVAPNSKDPVILRWGKVKGARGYTIQVSGSRDFARPIVDEKVAGTEFKLRTVPTGKTYWHVAAVAGAETSPYSDRGTLEANVPAPTLSNKYRLTSAALDFPAVAGAERYLIQVSRGRDLNQLQSQISTRPRATLDESGGTFFVRVAVANSAGEAISSFSSLAQVDVAKTPTLSAPALSTPPNHAHAPSRGGRISIIFSWERSNTADQYVLEISNDENFKHVIERKVTTERGAVYKQAALTGRVFWRVRAKGAGAVSEWSKPNSFDVD